MKQGYIIEDLIFSFYNSLTLAFSELDGRYYGGGVLELTPNEFKNLPIPLVSISNKNFEQFTCSFKNKKSIEDILTVNDYAILKSIDKEIDNDTIKKVFIIREKLYQRRIKKS